MSLNCQQCLGARHIQVNLMLHFLKLEKLKSQAEHVRHQRPFLPYCMDRAPGQNMQFPVFISAVFLQNPNSRKQNYFKETDLHIGLDEVVPLAVIPSNS